MLALAAARLNTPSETFIRDHARLIASNATVLVCQDGASSEAFGYPVFAGLSTRYHNPSMFTKVSRRIADWWFQHMDRPQLWLNRDLYGLPTRADTDRLYSFLRTHNVTVVLAEYGPVGLQVADVCLRAGIPLFVHFHGWDANILGRSRSIRRAYKRLFEAAAGIIVTTEFLKGKVLALGCPEEKLHVCPCGVDISRFHPGSAAREKRILMVSRLIPWKGPDYSLRSYAQIVKAHPDSMLEIVGEGPLLQPLQALAAELGIVDHVVFHGARDHDFVRERLEASVLFIQHPVTIPGDSMESQGLSILEAMAAGVPVVSTRHGAIVETVEEGVSGLLVDERDIGAMAAAIDGLLCRPDEAAAMGKAGRARVVARYNQPDSIKRLQAILGLGRYAA